MDTPSGLVIDSVTGVDVALPVAGPGARSFAFLIDWHIRAILSVAWYIVAAIRHNRGWSIAAPLTPDSAWFIYVLAPAATIYFLYHPVLEVATRGRTPGKRMAGVQIVTRHGEAPGIGPLLARNVFRLIDSFPVAYAVGLITTMITRNHVRIGDLAAGTVLVYTHREAELAAYSTEPAAAKQLNATTTEVLSELLHRWDMLDTEARDRIARTILADPGAGPAAGAGADTTAGVGAADSSALRAQLEKLAGGGRA